VRVNEAKTEKRTNAKRAPYLARKNVPKAKAREDLEFRPKFEMTYKELLSIPGVVEKLKFPYKSERNLGPRKDAWCEFNKGFGHHVEQCITLGHQLAGLVKDRFLKKYLEGNQGGSKE